MPTHTQCKQTCDDDIKLSTCTVEPTSSACVPYLQIALEFPSTFWEADVDFFGATLPGGASSRGRCFMFWSLHRFCGAPILLALVAGQAAYDSEGKEPEELQEAAMKVLRQLFGEAVPQPTACDASQWVCDTFTRGEAMLTASACKFRCMLILSCAPEFCMKTDTMSVFMQM